jgi:HAD superfamily hydrolase (TIGR01549 family)
MPNSNETSARSEPSAAPPRFHVTLQCPTPVAFPELDVEADDEGGAALSAAYIDGISRRGDLLPGCRSTLGRLKRRYRLGLVTNGLDRVQRSRLRVARLEGCFDVVVTSEACGFAKPDPRILRVALQALGVGAAEALYVGDDREVDGGAARAAGMRFVWMDRAGDVPAEADADVPRVRALRDVVDLLGAERADYNPASGSDLEGKPWTRPS